MHSVPPSLIKAVNDLLNEEDESADEEFLYNTIQQQIENPRYAVVNSESAFVRDRLEQAGKHELARKYWSWIASGYDPHWKLQAIYSAQRQLDAVESKSPRLGPGDLGT